MKKISVKKHFRKRKKGGVSVVRKHFRDSAIKSPVKVNYKHKADQADSLAHTETKFEKKNGKLVIKEHVINLDTDKIKKNGENVKDILNHEMGHVVDAELVKNRKKPTDTFSNSEEGKKVIKHFKKGKNKKRSGPELFADAYAHSKKK